MTIQELSDLVGESTHLSKKDVLMILTNAIGQLGKDNTIIVPNTTNTETLTYKILLQ